MRIIALIAGIVCIFGVLWDAFQTIIVPRRATGAIRLTRLFYIATWRPWSFFARRLRTPRNRETAFSFYGPLSLILLLILWAAVMIAGFGLIYFSIGVPFYDLRQRPGILSDLYVSGSTLFTLGPSDAGPVHPAARWLMVLESGTGFGFLAIIMGYFPVLYGAFSRREVSISLLDARAGSPPTAAELLRRHIHPGAAEALSVLLIEWERWSAELLESHISFPLLCYFRSQHTSQSWLSALTSILDTSSLLIAGVQGHEARQAQLTFAMARHALVDLTQIFNLKPRPNAAERLPPERYNQLYSLLCQGGVSMCRDNDAEQRLTAMRRLYEPWAEALSAHFSMPLPPWFPSESHRDNWLAVARLREDAESANPPAAPIAGEGHTHSLTQLHDDHHDF
ncbi:MAG: two pore domain potassium channel family protein [Terracidiphilus sp.]